MEAITELDEELQFIWRIWDHFETITRDPDTLPQVREATDSLAALSLQHFRNLCKIRDQLKQNYRQTF